MCKKFDYKWIIWIVSAVAAITAAITTIFVLKAKQKKDDEQLGILEAGNRAANAGLGINNADDYLKQILGGN